MPMTVDAALVTRKGRNAEFNTGSLNASGKTWQRERIHSDKGVFVAGRAEQSPYYAVASSSVKGIAESAAELFNECAPMLKDVSADTSEILDGFFRTFASFIKENADLDSSCFNMAVLAGAGDNIHIGISGNSAAYKLSGGELSEIVSKRSEYSDGKSSYGVSEAITVVPGDIFLLFGAETAESISPETLNAVCSCCSDDIQLMLRKLAAAALAAAQERSVSLAAVKIVSVEHIDAFPASAQENVPVSEDVSLADGAAAVSGMAKESDSEENLLDESEQDGNDNEPVSRRKTVGFIVVAAVLAVLVLALGIVAIKGIIYYKGGKEPATTTEEQSTVVEENTTAVIEETSVAVTEESTTEAESTTVTRPVETTTRRRYTVNTTAPSEQNTTEAPVSEPSEIETVSESVQSETADTTSIPEQTEESEITEETLPVYEEVTTSSEEIALF